MKHDLVELFINHATLSTPTYLNNDHDHHALSLGWRERESAEGNPENQRPPLMKSKHHEKETNFHYYIDDHAIRDVLPRVGGSGRENRRKVISTPGQS